MAAARDRDDEAFWRLQRWRTIVDEAIVEARERGDFDDLPGHGKPLDLRTNPLAGDRELAFHILEHAGVAPPWMEADKEVRAERAALAALLPRIGAGRAAPDRAPAEPPSWDEVSAFPWRLPRPPIWPFRRRERATTPPAPPPRPRPPTRPWGGAAARERARRRYLEQAARLDAAITRRNAALPADLRFLEQLRLSPDRAAREFDAAWPPGR